MSADGLDGLEDVDLAVLDHLLDARVRRAVDARATLAVSAEEGIDSVPNFLKETRWMTF